MYSKPPRKSHLYIPTGAVPAGGWGHCTRQPRGYQTIHFKCTGCVRIILGSHAHLHCLCSRTCWTLPSKPPMPGTRDSQARRIKEVTGFVRSQNWSLNDFLLAFYSSGDTSIATHRGRCLTKVDGARFAPEELVDLWLQHCPSGSQNYLEHVIVERASRIITKETDKACALKSLCVSTTSVKADDLDDQFLLSRLEPIYTTILPCLWFLLHAVITSSNRSEQQKQHAAAGKETRARFVKCLLGCNTAS